MVRCNAFDFIWLPRTHLLLYECIKCPTSFSHLLLCCPPSPGCGSGVSGVHYWSFELILGINLIEPQVLREKFHVETLQSIPGQYYSLVVAYVIHVYGVKATAGLQDFLHV